MSGVLLQLVFRCLRTVWVAAFCVVISLDASERIRRQLESELIQMQSEGQSLERLMSIAKLYEGLEDYETAAKCLYMASKMEGADDEVIVELARTFVRAGRVSGALHLLQKGAETYPDSAAIYFGQGNVYLSLKDGNAAVAAFEKAVSLDPSSAEYRFKLADVLVTANQYEKVEGLLKPLVELGEASENEWMLYALVLLRTERERQGLRMVEKLYEAYPESEKARQFLLASFMDVANAYSEEGRIGRAVKTLEDAIEAVPGDKVVLLQLAVWENEQGNPAQSIVYCEKVLDEDSENLDALEFMGRMLRIEGRTEKADDTFRRALAIARKKGDRSRADVLDELLNALK